MYVSIEKWSEIFVSGTGSDLNKWVLGESLITNRSGWLSELVAQLKELNDDIFHLLCYRPKHGEIDQIEYE